MDPSYRYRPDKNTPLALWEFVDLVEKNLHRHLTVTDIKAMISYDPATLYRQVRRHMGPEMTVVKYHCYRRLQRAHRILLQGDRDLKISALAESLGFKSHSHFTHRYTAHWGESPQETHKQGILKRLQARQQG